MMAGANNAVGLLALKPLSMLAGCHYFAHTHTDSFVPSSRSHWSLERHIEISTLIRFDMKFRRRLNSDSTCQMVYRKQWMKLNRNVAEQLADGIVVNVQL